MLSQPRQSVLTHFMLKCHDRGEVYLNCVFQQNKNFLHVVGTCSEVGASIFSVRLEAAK